MDHGEARRLMAKSMETKLSTDEERGLAMHLVGCAECKELFAGLQHAHPALSSLAPGSPPADAIDRAVLRATTVLRGEADPGPVARQALVPEAPPAPFPDDYQSGPIVIPAQAPAEPEVPLEEVEWDESPGAIRPVEADDLPLRTIEEPEPVRVIEPPVVTDAPAYQEPPVLPELEEDEPLPPPPPRLQPEEPRPVVPPIEQPIVVGPRSEIDELLDEERRRLEPLPYPDEGDDLEGPRPGMWLIAIAVAVALAVIALVVVTRGQKLFGSSGGDLPKPADVKSRVSRVFTDMKSLKATFSIERLSLYRIDTQDKAAVYSFSNGRYAGNMTYDKAEGYRQEFKLTAASKELSRATIVQSPDQTQSIIGNSAFVTEKNPPLGPPDGAFRPNLGLFEDAIGTIPTFIANAKNLKVVGKSTKDTRDLIEVRFAVKATELSRADQMDVFLDAQNYLPVVVRRSISRDNAQVLGPPSALTPDVLDKAFGKNTRVTTEVTELTNIVKDDIILPGDFALNAPASLKAQESDGHFEQITQAGVATKLDFKPLFPTQLPDGFEQGQLAVFRGKPAGWGPGNTLPAPKNIFNVSYFNGATTVVISERQMAQPFDITTSPLSADLPITVRTVNRGSRAFYFGASPEVPPHAFGFIGNTFVMATGDLPQAELIKIVASLQVATATVPAAVDLSPAPSGSPSASPSSTGATLPAG